MSEQGFPSSKVVCHSRAPNGEELITLEIELHRFILPEFNTHRSLSRNFQSSRAVPVEKMIQQVRDNPAMPVHWGLNQRGMVADIESESYVLDNTGQEFTVQEWWMLAAEEAASSAEAMSEAGYHKQIVNRLLEPFMKTKGVVTATREAFEAMFLLRCHKDAQPEFKLLAERMRASIEASTPQELQYGEYHLPYVDNNHCYSKESAIQLSASCNAQVSYRVLDDSLEKALKIYDMLNLPENGVYKEDPPHCYDEDTEVLTERGYLKWKDLNGERLAVVSPDNGTFIGFTNDYKPTVHTVDTEMFHYKGTKIDLMVTQGHNLYASLINKASDRVNSDYRLFKADTLNGVRSRTKYLAQRPMKMRTSCTPSTRGSLLDSELALDELVGFFIGDGSLPSDGSVNGIRFHLIKERKISYLRELCYRIEGASLNEYKGGNFHVSLKGAKDFFSVFVEGGNKRLPISYWEGKSQESIDSIFKGLKNSDGNIKRKTWVYSTSSEVLKNDILQLSPLYGYSVTISYVNLPKSPLYNTNWVLNVGVSREVLVNDSRTAQTVELVPYTGKVYCADTGGNVLIVRRNGKVVLSGNCSPTEHIAKVVQDYDHDSLMGGNFVSCAFWQYRKALEIGQEQKFINN